MAGSTASTKSSSSVSRAREFALAPRGGVLLIDAECVLCNRFARFLIGRDRQGLFVFVPKSSETARELLVSLDLPTVLPETIVLIRRGRLHLFSDVSFRALGDLAFPWNLARLLLAVPKALRDPFYKFIARNRHRFFGTTTACGLLSPEERTRVLW